jgi:adenylate kinase
MKIWSVKVLITKLERRKGIPPVIYIIGSPGTGKTRTAKKLSQTLKGTHLELSRIAQQRGYTLGYDPARRCSILAESKMNSYIKQAISNTKRPTILDAHFTVKLPTGIKPWVFVLRCNPETLARRLRYRGYPVKKIHENIWAEILDFCLQEALNRFGARRIHEIDVSRKTVQDIITEILNVIEGRQKPQIGSFNWLEKLEREDKLDRIIRKGNML